MIKTFPYYQLLRSNKSPSEFFGIFLHIYLKFTFTLSRLRPAAGVGRLGTSAFSWMRSFLLSFDILIIRIQLRSQGFTPRSWLGFRFWTGTKRLRFFIFCGIGSRFAFSRFRSGSQFSGSWSEYWLRFLNIFLQLYFPYIRRLNIIDSKSSFYCI